jgi:Aldo/keto reductase family
MPAVSRIGYVASIPVVVDVMAPKVRIAESIGALAEVKEEGKIRHIGRSNFSRRPAQGDGAGDPGGFAWHEVIDQGELHDWRAAQLIRLGFPRPLAETVADHVHWHEIAR